MYNENLKKTSVFLQYFKLNDFKTDKLNNKKNI